MITQGQEASTPTSPGTGYGRVYPKSDGLWYYQDENGVEYVVDIIGATVSVTTTPYAVVGTEGTIEIDCTSASIVVNLPAGASARVGFYRFKRKDSSANTVTLTPNGAETIDGSASLSIAALAWAVLQWNGTEWSQVG